MCVRASRRRDHHAGKENRDNALIKRSTSRGFAFFLLSLPHDINRLKQSAKPPPDALKYSLDVGNTAIIQFQ